MPHIYCLYGVCRITGLGTLINSIANDFVDFRVVSLTYIPPERTRPPAALVDWTAALQRFPISLHHPQLRVCTEGSASPVSTPWDRLDGAFMRFGSSPNADFMKHMAQSPLTLRPSLPGLHCMFV